MKRGMLVGIIAGVVVIALAMWFVLIAPVNKDVSKKQTEVAAANQQTQQLQAQFAHLKELSANAPKQQATLRQLNASIPENPALANFYIQANNLATASGLDWVSITSATPAASTAGGPTTIALTINISGSFYQLLDYLTRLEALDRLVTLQGIDVGTGSSSGAASSAGSSTVTSSGSDNGELSVTLTGQMYTQQAPPVAPGTAPTTPTAPGGTSATTTPGGATATTTAPASSSKTGGTST